MTDLPAEVRDRAARAAQQARWSLSEPVDEPAATVWLAVVDAVAEVLAQYRTRNSLVERVLRAARNEAEQERDEALTMLRELVDCYQVQLEALEPDEWTLSQVFRRARALVERAGQAGAHPAESERCGFSADGRHRRGTGRDRNECADCDAPMRPAENED